MRWKLTVPPLRVLGVWPTTAAVVRLVLPTIQPRRERASSETPHDQDPPA
jgi:hypothetical protein